MYGTLSAGSTKKAGSKSSGKKGAGGASNAAGKAGNGKGGAVAPAQTLNWRSTGIDVFIGEAMAEVYIVLWWEDLRDAEVSFFVFVCFVLRRINGFKTKLSPVCFHLLRFSYCVPIDLGCLACTTCVCCLSPLSCLRERRLVFF